MKIYLMGERKEGKIKITDVESKDFTTIGLSLVVQSFFKIIILIVE